MNWVGIIKTLYGIFFLWYFFFGLKLFEDWFFGSDGSDLFGVSGIQEENSRSDQ